MTLTNEEENRAPDISVEDKVLKDEPGDVEDDKESEGGDTGTLDDDGDDDRDDEDRDDEGNDERDDDVGDIEDEKKTSMSKPPG